MLSDENYSYIKLLYKLSNTLSYVKNHAIPDAEKAGHELSMQMYEEMQHDLEQNIEKVRSAIEGLSKEDKFR